jgi:mannose-6-phosphate isomerase-like protein (cupin superfamily)
MTQTASRSGLEMFSYERPLTLDQPKITINLARSSNLGFGIQVLKEGGETNLHAHAASEAVWFVLKGRVRFYDTDDHVFGEYGPWEGIGIPRAAPYWFESASDEQLEIIHITAKNKLGNNLRLNFTPLRERQVDRHEHSSLRDLDKHHAKPMQSIRYDSPDFDQFPKKITNLYNQRDLLNVSVQKVRDGGETNLHAHTGMDSLWFVLSGAARFYGSDPADVFELGTSEGILIPLATPYWFESTSPRPLEVLHVTARDMTVEKNERVNYEDLKDWQDASELGGRSPTDDEKY